MVNRAGTEGEAKENTQTSANGFNVVHRKPKKGASGASGDGADVQVTNVPAEFGEVELLKRHHLFGKYGRVVKINVVAGANKGKNATVSVTVTYSTPAEAGLAAHCVDGASLSGQTLVAKCSSPSPTTERPVRPTGSDVKFLPAIPKSLQPTPTQASGAASEPTTKVSDARKAPKPTQQNQSPTPQPQTQQQKPIATAAIAPGVSAWSKPLATGVTKAAAASNASPTNPAAAAPAPSAAKSTNAASEQSPKQASPTFGAGGKQQSQNASKQSSSAAPTAAAIVRGSKGGSASPSTPQGSVTLPASLSKFTAGATVDVEFGGDEAEGAPKMSILDQPTPTGPFTGTFAAPGVDRGLFDADQHISSVLSDSGAIDNTPPRPTEVSQPSFDNNPTTRVAAPQSYANVNGAPGAQNSNRPNSQRRPGSNTSGGRGGGRRGGDRGQGSPLAQPAVGGGVSPQLPPQTHGGPLPPNFNMGRTKLNPEAPEFYPAAAMRNPGLPGGIPLNDGRGMYGGDMYGGPQYPPHFQGAPQVPWGPYPPAGGARGAPPFGAGPRGYWQGGYPPAGYQ